MNNNEIEIIEGDFYDPALTKTEQSGLLSSNSDDIFEIAAKAEEYIKATKRIMEAAVGITTEYDWVLIGGQPYLQESGASKVASLFGISVHLLGKPTVECDKEGYKTFTYNARFTYNNRMVDCDGSRSMKDDFFAKTKNGMKKPDEIDELDVKRSAYTNCLNNGIKRLIPGLRNIDISVLENAKLDTGKIRGYTFKTGSKGGSTQKAEDTGLTCEICGKAITQKVASFSQSKFGKMLCMDCQKTANVDVKVEGATE